MPVPRRFLLYRFCYTNGRCSGAATLWLVGEGMARWWSGYEVDGMERARRNPLAGLSPLDRRRESTFSFALSAFTAPTAFSSMALASAAVPCANAVLENMTAMAPSAANYKFGQHGFPPC